jgi:hypothetical protein
MQDLISVTRLPGLRLLALSLAFAFGMQIWPIAEDPAQMAHAHEAVAQMFVHSGAAPDFADAAQELCKQHCLAIVGLVPVAPALPAPGHRAAKDRLADLVPSPMERPQPDAPPPKPLFV